MASVTRVGGVPRVKGVGPLLAGVTPQRPRHRAVATPPCPQQMELIRVPYNAAAATSDAGASPVPPVPPTPATEETVAYVQLATIAPHRVWVATRVATVTIPAARPVKTGTQGGAPMPLLETEVRSLLITDTVPAPVPDTAGRPPPLRSLPEPAQPLQDPLMADGVHTASGRHLARPVGDTAPAAPETFTPITRT